MFVPFYYPFLIFIHSFFCDIYFLNRPPKDTRLINMMLTLHTYHQNKQGRYVKALAASFVHRQQDTGVLNIYKVNVNAS